MKGFTKGKGKGKKFIPTSRKKSGLKKSDIIRKKDSQRDPLGLKQQYSITMLRDCHKCHELKTNTRWVDSDKAICSDCEKNRSKKTLDSPKLKTFKVSETNQYDNDTDFESHHIDTIEAKDFEDAEKKVAKMFKIKESDIMEVGADLGEDIVGYTFDYTPYDGTTGEKISKAKAEKMVDKDEDSVTHVTHGFELEEVKDDDK